VIDEIMSSEKSDLISYHLAKNPNELDALNAMNSRELARAMGRLEATLKLPEAKKQTSAPAPLSRSKGGAAPHSQEADSRHISSAHTVEKREPFREGIGFNGYQYHTQCQHHRESGGRHPRK
jgi:hypothetical protein